jgi:hypothetical protein
LASSYAHAAVSVLSSSRSIRFGEYDEVTAFGISQGFGTIDQTTTQSFPARGHSSAIWAARSSLPAAA